MTTYTLTVSTDDLGLGVIDGGQVVVTRKRATAADQYPPVNALYEITTATDADGIATAELKADDSSTYHVCRVWDADGAVVYQQTFSMPPDDGNLADLSEAVIGASNIQFKDEGTNRGTPSTTRNVNFTGADVSATFSGETLTVNVDASATAATAVSTHVAASDPHGDRAYAESLVVGLWNDRGNFDASVNAYPSSGGSGTAGAIRKGDIWTVSAAGTLPTAQVVEVGDTVRALVNTPGNTQANWAIQQNNIGYVPENSASKSTDGTMAGNSDTLYPSQKAAKTYIDTAVLPINNGKNTSYAFINRMEHFLGDNDQSFFGVSGFTNPGSLTPADIASISGASDWRGCAKHAVSTGSGSRYFIFGGTYSDSIAGSGGANLAWRSGDKLQMIWNGAISFLPDASNQFCFTVGFSSVSSTSGYNASTTADYSHALIWGDNTTTNWQCYSRSATGGTEQTTDSGVPVAALTSTVLQPVIDTTGNVLFYINGALVATHSAGGKIQQGDEVFPVLGWNNKASLAATRHLYSTKVGYLLQFSGLSGPDWK